MRVLTSQVITYARTDNEGTGVYKRLVPARRWPHCAAAWYEPGKAPEKPGKPPKQRKTWKVGLGRKCWQNIK